MKNKTLATQTNLKRIQTFFTANRVHEGLDWDVRENYKAAVAPCLRCSFPSGNSASEEAGHRLYIYEEIVKPLEKELIVLCKIGVERLDETLNEEMKHLSANTPPTKANPRTTTDSGSTSVPYVHTEDYVIPNGLGDTHRVKTRTHTAEGESIALTTLWVDGPAPDATLSMFDEHHMLSNSRIQL